MYLIEIRMEFIPKNLINNKSALFQNMAWCRTGILADVYGIHSISPNKMIYIQLQFVFVKFHINMADQPAALNYSKLI